MGDEEQPHSGSRWEPAPTPTVSAATAQDESRGVSGSPAGRVGPTRPFGVKGRAAVAGAAVALVALGGFGGLVLGHVASGDEDDGDRVGLVGDPFTTGADDNQSRGSGSDDSDADFEVEVESEGPAS